LAGYGTSRAGGGPGAVARTLEAIG